MGVNVGLGVFVAVGVNVGTGVGVAVGVGVDVGIVGVKVGGTGIDDAAWVLHPITPNRSTAMLNVWHTALGSRDIGSNSNTHTKQRKPARRPMTLVLSYPG